MAAVASSSGGERPDTSPAMDVLSSKSATDVASDSSSSSFATETPDLNDHSNISASPSREVDPHSQASARSEEYRQLFRLPTEEVLIQDFNCAYQESILLQGHMYLFVHHICFYSNIFGFETKKTIPFHEITDVKRAKTAGIFPNAIEICAGGKKYFFASFLSRDEALKLISDGWLQHGNGSNLITEQQDSISVTSNPDNGLAVTEKVNNFKQVSELDPSDREMVTAPSPDSKISASVENGTVSITQIQVADEVEQDVELVRNTNSLSSTTLAWNVESFEAPQRRESFKEVGETKFPIKVVEFFNLFFSDDAASFVESFHSRCGDKEFRCSLWYPNEEFGHARDVSFQHPIKIYFGAKFGSCQEVQKFRVYRNSNLVIETSQQISDVPFGDCFCVEGLWDVTRDRNGSNEGCILRIYVDVVFSKKIIFKGKIVQSTVEECREAYAIWINMAHELLKQKNLEKQEAGLTLSMIHEEEVHSEREVETGEASENSYKPRGHVRMQMQQMSSSVAVSQQADDLVQGNFTNATSIASLLGEYATKIFLFFKSQSQISLVLVIAFIVIILMQVSILVLLNRPQTVHVASPEYYMGGLRAGAGEKSAEAVAWLERRMHHLKDEMFMVEAKLERLQQEHSWLKSQLKNLDDLEKHK
ncbi:PREDICTED: GRAM domain-containing protein 1A isoform X2 [Populus euphratica]|uniref:GRAM domain-containing protein 1A isoform X2 n=1 Tax=Populus euphratica TaxID=75702 RepID=A0AAJ6XV22_POPEU|nr:PREDICTED: GRAM domain-containing protein 1A isoform X2 [Populus euphratica]